MDNQQETIKETDLAWLAGMINGDGCLHLNLRLRKQSVCCDVGFTLTQTDPGIINHAWSLVEQIIGGQPYLQTREPPRPGNKPVYHMSVNKMSQIARFLPRVIPHMVGQKRAAAEILLRYVTNRLRRKGKKAMNSVRLNADDMNIAREFYAAKGKPIPKTVDRILRGHTHHSQVA